MTAPAPAKGRQPVTDWPRLTRPRKNTGAAPGEANPPALPREVARVQVWTNFGIAQFGIGQWATVKDELRQKLQEWAGEMADA